MFFFLVEYLFDDATFFQYIVNTQPEKDALTELIKKNQPGMSASDEFLPFPVACFIKIISVFATFTWNYLDAFIMVFSVGLSTHFKLINDELEHAILLAQPDIVYSHLYGVHPILKVNHQLK